MTASSGVGPLLREWRRVRRLSQLDLALQMDVSARHVSRVESGHAQPSRRMVARLADALEVPGARPGYSSRSVSAGSTRAARHAGNPHAARVTVARSARPSAKVSGSRRDTP
jgi:transcriptional regulator with XRE-family HTH domain